MPQSEYPQHYLRYFIAIFASVPGASPATPLSEDCALASHGELDPIGWTVRSDF